MVHHAHSLIPFIVTSPRKNTIPSPRESLLIRFPPSCPFSRRGPNRVPLHSLNEIARGKRKATRWYSQIRTHEDTAMEKPVESVTHRTPFRSRSILPGNGRVDRFPADNARHGCPWPAAAFLMTPRGGKLSRSVLITALASVRPGHRPRPWRKSSRPSTGKACVRTHPRETGCFCQASEMSGVRETPGPARSILPP